MFNKSDGISADVARIRKLKEETPMVTDLLLEAANLMLIGMVAVFSFLLMLVFIVKLISAVTLRFFPLKVTNKTVRKHSGDSTSPAVIAAISSAIHQYRQQQ
jgi:oxaloacetate decarboxylase (Na+ extruding) subunit gamma